MHSVAEDDHMGSTLPWLTVYTVLSNWNHEADTYIQAELVSTLNGMVLFFYVCNIVGLEARLEEP